jgi:hypothetical protein
MANSIKVSQKREWIEGTSVARPDQLKTFTIETTSDLIDEKTQIVGTTHELISVGDITDDAYVEIHNPHATAIVQIGHEVAAAFVPVIDIPPGYPPARMPVVSTLAATYLKSDTASTPVRVTLVKIVAPA